MARDKLLPPSFQFVGKTANFEVFSETTLGLPGVGIANTVLQTAEADFAALVNIFSGKVPGSLPFTVYFDDTTKGASHPSCTATEITVGFAPSVLPTPAGVAEYHRMVMVAEMVEVFASNFIGWPCGESTGEGLSRVLGFALHSGGFSVDLTTAPIWLDQNPRPDWVAQTALSDTYPIGVGCSVLFLNWLHYSLGHAWSDIVDAGGKTLQDVYANLVPGGDGRTTFLAAMSASWPVGKPSGLTTDQPF